MDIREKVRKYMDDHNGTTHKSDLELIVWNRCSPEEYLELFPDGIFSGKVKRKVEFEKMRKNPMQYPIEKVYSFVKEGIFTFDELEQEGLLWKNEKDEYGDPKWNPTPDGLDGNFEQFLTNQELKGSEDCTDIYFFGTPGTGKTCLLQGILNYDGFDFINTTQGGRYGDALIKATKKGKPAEATIGKMAAVLNGSIDVLKDGSNIVSHNINIVELAGEDFAYRMTQAIDISKSEDDREKEIANANFKFSDMGLNVTKFLGESGNPKVFFLVIDAMSNEKKYKGLPYFQSDVLNGFIHIFSENPDVMKQVKAIHIVVTKTDMLSGDNVYELLKNTYTKPIKNLLKYIEAHTWLNTSTGRKPFVFPFSLGRFYLGNLFKYDKTDSDRIVNVIKSITQGRRQETWWDNVTEFLG